MNNLDKFKHNFSTKNLEKIHLLLEFAACSGLESATFKSQKNNTFDIRGYYDNQEKKTCITFSESPNEFTPKQQEEVLFCLAHEVGHFLSFKEHDKEHLKYLMFNYIKYSLNMPQFELTEDEKFSISIEELTAWQYGFQILNDLKLLSKEQADFFGKYASKCLITYFE